MNTAPFFLFDSILLIFGSLPLILKMVKMNPIYGVRISEAFRSEARWYQINRFGGVLMLLLGVIVGITGAVGLTLQHNQWAKFNIIAIGILLGGLGLVTSAIYIYAAKTKKH